MSQNSSTNVHNVGNTKYLCFMKKGEFIMRKKISSLILGALLITTTLIGCGSSDTTSTSTTTTPTQNTESTTPTDSDNSNDDIVVAGGVVTIAANPTPGGEILEIAVPLLAEKGYELEITIFSDYVMPNNVVESEEIDCNFFQSIPYLHAFNDEHGTSLVDIGDILYAPLGIYPGSENDITNIPEGTTIAIPNDVTNEGRALMLLETNGILTLREGAELTATVLDVIDNPYNVELIEMEPAQISRVIDEMGFVVLNGTYAIQSGLSVMQDAIAYETPESVSAKTFVNVVAVKEGNENNPGIVALVDVLQSDEVVDFMLEKFDGAVVPSVN